MSNPLAGESVSVSQPVPFAAGKKVWVFPEEEVVPQDLIDAAVGSKVIAALLFKRGIKTAEDARSFLDESCYSPTSFAELPDVEKAVQRILKALEAKQKITIYGDYDVDGVTGTSVLLTVLKQLGADVDYYIPNRVNEGYGLNLKAISILASKKKTKLIITCDCGVSNFAEINFARSLSVDTIVLDHHTIPEVLPPAVAVVHPKLLPEDHPLYHLPGVGVAYKVCEALLTARGLANGAAELLDFVTLGMIADLVPLVKENRYLVKVGLDKLVNTCRIGLKALLAQVNGQNDTDLVGFGIAPRINAAGRLSDANKAVELLTTDDTNLAAELAHELQTENARRQELCEKIFSEADLKVQRQPDWQNQKCIAIYDRQWHHGVVGIVASRLVEKYHRPVFIGQLDAEQGIVKGSARGVEQIDLYEVLKANGHLLTKWGGHKMAAGFSVEYAKADELCRSLVDTCNRMLSGKPLAGIIEIDLVVKEESVDIQLARLLRVLAPFGMANRKPRFLMRQLTCIEVRELGKEGKHNRLMLKGSSDCIFESVMWNSQGRVPAEGQTIDLVFTADINNFNNRERLQLVVNDWRAAFQGTEVTSISEIGDGIAGGRTAPLEVAAAPVTSVAAPTAGGAVPATGVVVPIGTVIGAAPGSTSTFGSNALSGSENTTGGAALGTGGGSSLAAGSQNVLAHRLQPFPKGAPAGTYPAQSAEADKIVQIVQEVNIPVRDPIGSIKQIWRDLRRNERPEDLLRRGADKLGSRLSIFAEACTVPKGYRFLDRLTLSPTRHLMFWQFPPSNQVFKDILDRTSAEHVYLIGSTPFEIDEPALYLKRLYGLVRYAVNQKDGKVEAEKLIALMGSTKLSLALALAVLKRVHLIDWFAEDGIINLDCLGHAEGAFDDCPEFQQLALSLDEARTFRNWCSETPVKEIQLAFMRHGVSLSSSSTNEEEAIGDNGKEDAYSMSADDNADALSLEQRINDVYDNTD